MPGGKSTSTCSLIMEVLVGSQALEKVFFPVSKRTASIKKNQIKVLDDFEGSFIKKLWDSNKKVAEEHVFVDKDLLKKLYPKIDVSAKGTGFSFGKLGEIKDIPGKADEERFQAMSMKNGGWIVVPPNSKIPGDKSCYPTPSDADLLACSMVTVLGKMQSSDVYNLKKKVIPKKVKDGLEIPLSEVDQSLKGMTIVAEGGTKLPGASYSVSTYIESPLTFWTRVDDKDGNGLKAFKREVERAASGETSKISTYEDFKTWGRNVINEGKGDVTKEVGFQLDKSIPLSSSFRRQEHTKQVGGVKVQINSVCTAPIVVLVDHLGRIVPVERVSGKKQSKTISEVVKGTTPVELAKWKMYCVDGKRTGTMAVIPKQVRVKRSLNAVRSGKNHVIAGESIKESTRDVAKTAWNVMVRSAIDHNQAKYQGKSIEAIATDVLTRSREVSGKERSATFEKYLISEGGLLHVDSSEPLEAPYMASRTATKGRGGLTAEMNEMIKKGPVVGVETDFKELEKKC